MKLPLGTQAIPLDRVTEIAKVSKLRPTESDVAAAFGRQRIKRKYRADGNYEWRMSFKPNEGGKRTRDQGKMLELMKPFMRADSERHARNQATIERVALKDGAGSVHYVEPERADDVARQNGWKTGRARGNPVEVGSRGMLFRWLAGSWYPLGVRCLGTPLRGSARLPRRGIYDDPSGESWRWIQGDWHKL